MEDSIGPKFPAGSMVHVRPLIDGDDSDMPFCGWVGRVAEVQEDTCITCLVRWSPETLASVSPFFKDGWNFTETWLDEDDLEQDDGGLRTGEQPADTAFSGDSGED